VEPDASVFRQLSVDAVEFRRGEDQRDQNRLDLCDGHIFLYHCCYNHRYKMITIENKCKNINIIPRLRHSGPDDLQWTLGLHMFCPDRGAIGSVDHCRCRKVLQRKADLLVRLLPELPAEVEALLATVEKGTIGGPGVFQLSTHLWR